MTLGVAYYPEFYDRKKWEKDVNEIAEIGFKVVRMAEFAWCRLEPYENQYDFTWLEEIIEAFAQKGIKTILGTPTGAPPQWAVLKYPDLTTQNKSKTPNNFVGGFGSYCKNHAGYRELSKKIVTALVSHFKDNENIIMYQIDNEFMGEVCYCDACTKAYTEWAKKEYVTIENYNKKMMTIFQGRELQSFDDFIALTTYKNIVNPAVLMDYKKFVSQTYYDYCKNQVDIIRKISPTVMVTSNYCTLFNNFDHFRMATMFDVAGVDTYPKADNDFSLRNSYKLDLTRALKKKGFWVLEQQCSPVAFREYNYSLEPLEARLYTFKSIGHGADGIVYFRWNATHSGGERYGAGIIRHENEKGRIYYEVKRICEEIETVREYLDDSEKKSAKIAMVFSLKSYWALSEGRKITKDLDYTYVQMKLYSDLLYKNIDIDFVIPGDDISSYDIVIASTMASVNEEEANWLEKYVSNGGNCICTFTSGMFTEYNHITDKYYQGELRELLGIKVTEWDVPYQNENYTFKFNNKNYPATLLNMVLEPETAQCIGTYNNGFYKDSACITVNNYGKGKAYYVATKSNSDFILDLLNEIVPLNELVCEDIMGDMVDVKIRVKNGENFYIVMNYENIDKKIELKRNFTNTLTGEVLNGVIELKAFDVLLLR